MTNSTRYADELNALGAMLNSYPMQSEIVGIQLGVDGNEDVIVMVFLRPGQLAQGSAELIEWKRTLARPTGLVERSMDGSTVKIGVIGKGSESDADIVAWVNNIPYMGIASYLKIGSGSKIRFDLNLLHLWSIAI